MKAGTLDDWPSKPWTQVRVTRFRKQIPHEEEKKGKLGPLTGAYEFATYSHNPGISSDHVDSKRTFIDTLYLGKHKSYFRPEGRVGDLEVAAAKTEAMLETISQEVESAETRHAAAQVHERGGRIAHWLKGLRRR
jgi:hypothetical protein